MSRSDQKGSTALKTTLIDLLVLCHPELIPRVSWIDLCLKVGVDPGELVRAESTTCMSKILEATEPAKSPNIKLAASKAAAELAFVAPETILPILNRQIQDDLDPSLLEKIGPTEAAIYRTPEGTAFIDVLSKKSQDQTLNRKAKDYDTLKWEEELRAQLAQKKGQTKKLTAEEQAKVNAQLAKEAVIRREVTAINAKLRRGAGIISSLATGPPTDADIWMTEAVEKLLRAIDAGAGLITGDSLTVAFLHCSQRISTRLGALRPFVGVAILRAIGGGQLPEGFDEEPLGGMDIYYLLSRHITDLLDLVTRILYRLRFIAEQRAFDTVSLAYMLPLLFIILEKGGAGKQDPEEADEQIVLAIDSLSLHTDACMWSVRVNLLSETDAFSRLQRASSPPSHPLNPDPVFAEIYTALQAYQGLPLGFLQKRRPQHFYGGDSSPRPRRYRS